MPESLESIIADYPGVVTYLAANLATGQTRERAPDQPVRTASVIKVPIMVETFRQVAEGRRSWDQSLTLDKSVAVGGSGVLQDMSHGMQISLRDAMVLMIVLSDNTATNLVLDALEGGPAAVNACMQELGLPQTTCFRKAFSPDDPNNPDGLKFGLGRTTPREIVTLLTLMYQGRLVSPEASEEMIAIMKRQNDRAGIARRLPTGYISATKSGALDDVRNDVGLVYPSDGSGPVALAIFCGGHPPTSTYVPENIGLLTIARVTQALLPDCLWQREAQH